MPLAAYKARDGNEAEEELSNHATRHTTGDYNV
jgi:hypothetical protein